MENDMEANVGGADRAARLMAGGALLSAALVAPVDGKWRALMGVGGAAALGSGLSGYCPANQALGINTAQENTGQADVSKAIAHADFSQLPQIESGASAAGVVAG
jgi:hypothetical protein